MLHNPSVITFSSPSFYLLCIILAAVVLKLVAKLFFCSETGLLVIILFDSQLLKN